MTWDRRRPLRRGKPLTASTGLSRGDKPLRRVTALRPVSARRTAARPLRAETVAIVMLRDQYRCQLHGHGDCRGILDVHEVVRRSQHPGAELEPALCIVLCRRHHDLDRHRLHAEGLGIRVSSWAFDRLGESTLVEASVIRRAWRDRDAVVPTPSWWTDPDPGETR